MARRGWSGELISVIIFVTMSDLDIDPVDEAELRRIDLNLLLVFSAVMRAGSVRLAAQRLYLGPSGVSMALGRLRRMLGQPLFVRGPQGLAPTPFAERLHARVAPALAELGAAVTRERRFDPATASSVFRLALSDDLEMVVAPGLLRALQEASPASRLVLRASDYAHAAALLDNGGADLVLCAMPAKLEARHHSQVLYDEDFVVLSDPQVTPGAATRGLEGYVATPHVLVSALGALRGLIDEALEARGMARRVGVSVEHFSTLPHLLHAAPLLANAPRRAAHVLAARSGLAVHPLPIPSPRFRVAAVWHARTQDDPAQAWFRNLLIDVAKAAGPGGPPQA